MSNRGTRDPEKELPQAVVDHMESYSRSFLLSRRKDGSPTAHPMTALVSEGRISFNTYRKSAKTRNIELDPRMGAVLLNGYEPTAAADVHGYCVEGSGSIRSADEVPVRRGEGAQIGEGVAERVAERVASGKRILLDLRATRVRDLSAR